MSTGILFSVLRRSVTTDLLKRLRRPKPTHLLFCMADHYEPGLGQASADVQRQRVARLVDEYPALAGAHRDHYGNCYRRTWFFPPHDHCNGSLRRVVALCERGLGEIEFHLHHGKTRPDTSENLRNTINKSLEDYSVFGIFGTEEGRKTYGFIHGDWALNNSHTEGKFCGVNDEISILHETGCYADFTFPSSGYFDPACPNSVYYADTERHVPKSYNRGVPARANASPPPGLMLVQGPTFLEWSQRRPTFGDGLHEARHLTPGKFDALVTAWVHIPGKEDWVFIKTHTHGASREDVVNGKPMHDGLSYLENRYNDGKNYILHYVTARELYNIIKAAEAGKQGDPEEFRDYVVKPPCYDASPEIDAASPELSALVERTYRG